MAAFRGMHVSPAKHSFAWLPRKCGYRTDGRTDRQTKWSLWAAMLRRRHKNDISVEEDTCMMYLMNTYFEIREITQSYHMLSMSKTIDSEMWLSIIENRKALATDNRFISIIFTSLVTDMLWTRTESSYLAYLYIDQSQPIWTDTIWTRWDYGQFYTHFCIHSTMCMLWFYLHIFLL